MIGGKLLDIHTVYNVAFALTEFKSPEFIETVEKIEAIAHDLIHKLPADVPVVLTTVIAGDSEWGKSEWNRMEELGKARPPFCVVHINCDLEENIRRIQSHERKTKRKPLDPEMARRNQEQAKVLAGIDAKHLLQLDSTEMSAEQAARAIADWVSQINA